MTVEEKAPISDNVIMIVIIVVSIASVVWIGIAIYVLRKKRRVVTGKFVIKVYRGKICSKFKLDLVICIYMILTVNIPSDWENDSIKQVFKSIIAGYNMYGEMTLSETSPNEFEGVCGKNKKSIVPNPAKMQYKATFKIESGSNGSKLLTDYEEGKILKIGKLGKKYIKIYFESLQIAFKAVLEKPFSSFEK